MGNLNKLIILTLLLSGCAGPNPNIGERTVDNAMYSNNLDAAFKIVKPKAEAGEPWAQLRLGIYYTNGWGTKKDIEKSKYWYKKVIEQKSSGSWAEGKMLGAIGKNGYFNQNSDARIAQYNLALLYLSENTNLDEALKLVNNVIDETNGNAIFFCCEFAGGRSFTQKQFIELKTKLESKISEK